MALVLDAISLSVKQFDGHALSCLGEDLLHDHIRQLLGQFVANLIKRRWRRLTAVR